MVPIAGSAVTAANTRGAMVHVAKLAKPSFVNILRFISTFMELLLNGNNTQHRFGSGNFQPFAAAPPFREVRSPQTQATEQPPAGHPFRGISEKLFRRL